MCKLRHDRTDSEAAAATGGMGGREVHHTTAIVWLALDIIGRVPPRDERGRRILRLGPRHCLRVSMKELYCNGSRCQDRSLYLVETRPPTGQWHKDVLDRTRFRWRRGVLVINACKTCVRGEIPVQLLLASTGRHMLLVTCHQCYQSLRRRRLC